MMNHLSLLQALGLLALLSVTPVRAWTSRPQQLQGCLPHRSGNRLQVSTTSDEAVANSSGGNSKPIFDFSTANAVDKFERLDDAIMGGISTSQVVNAKDQPYAKWFGVCRTDGGGFCGMRTLPFQDPLAVGDADGFYMECRLASDNEPERRVWKMTTRVESSRGEVLYQAPFSFQATGEDEWSRVKVPFESFRLVRGPRMIADAPPLNVTGGLFQVGMTMSKFAFGQNTTEIENFRPGFFELQLKSIGLYNDEAKNAMETLPSPQVLSKEEAMRKRSILLKILLPLSKLFFSEDSQRRKSAMKILRDRRGLSRVGAIGFGLRNRACSQGLLRSSAKTMAILAADSLRGTALLALRLALIYPVKVVRKSIKTVASLFGTKPKASS